MPWPLRKQPARVRDVRWKLFRPVCWYRGCRRQYVPRYRRGCPRFASPRAELPEAAYSLNTPAHTRRLPDEVEVKWKFCGIRSNEEQSCHAFFGSCHQRCTGPNKACQHSLLPSDEKCRKRTADTKYGDDGKNNRRISRVVHEASYKRFPKPRTCIRYEVEETSCGP